MGRRGPIQIPKSCYPFILGAKFWETVFCSHGSILLYLGLMYEVGDGGAGKKGRGGG